MMKKLKNRRLIHNEEFKNLDFEKSIKLMEIPLIVDGRRIYDPERLKELGFQYYGVGAVNDNK